MKASELRTIIREEIGKVLRESSATKPIRSFKPTDLTKIFAAIGFPVIKVESFNDINAGPVISVTFKKPLVDENDFIDAYADFQWSEKGKAMALPNIKSGYHFGGNKWQFQMEK